MIINKDFKPKRDRSDRTPPGQYLVRDFPVLSLGPTPQIIEDEWKITFDGLCQKTEFNLEELKSLPSEEFTVDIHCVTKWSKLDTVWRGVSMDYIVEKVSVDLASATHIVAHSYDGYSTNLPIEDVLNGQAFIVFQYDNKLIESEHGGPVRLLVPHLYFWKSAKWLNRIEFVAKDIPGFWEVRGYHNYGDPWKEQRYTND